MQISQKIGKGKQMKEAKEKEEQEEGGVIQEIVHCKLFEKGVVVVVLLVLVLVLLPYINEAVAS